MNLDFQVVVSTPKSTPTPTLRVPFPSAFYTIDKILPNKVDLPASLMVVKKAPDLHSSSEMHLELFNALGVAQPKGVLLYGPPGRGRRSLFVTVMAREHAPSFIFMDEFDSIGSSRVEMEAEIQRLREPGRISSTLHPFALGVSTAKSSSPARAFIQHGTELCALAEMGRCSGAEVRGISTEAGTWSLHQFISTNMYALPGRRRYITQEDFEFAVVKDVKKKHEANISVNKLFS
ncbi:hypothetical protein H0H92_009181 [Tricholoma furcatifolium]|nr:hypothetical protein H0H92_009181 [Tricholoma furcatifolium]